MKDSKLEAWESPKICICGQTCIFWDENTDDKVNTCAGELLIEEVVNNNDWYHVHGCEIHPPD